MLYFITYHNEIAGVEMLLCTFPRSYHYGCQLSSTYFVFHLYWFGLLPFIHPRSFAAITQKDTMYKVAIGPSCTGHRPDIDSH